MAGKPKAFRYVLRLSRNAPALHAIFPVYRSRLETRKPESERLASARNSAMSHHGSLEIG
jgi:hypothetical protein